MLCNLYVYKISKEKKLHETNLFLNDVTAKLDIPQKFICFAMVLSDTKCLGK